MCSGKGAPGSRTASKGNSGNNTLGTGIEWIVFSVYLGVLCDDALDS